jgi:DnaJ-class molecular chaperone
MQTSISRQSWTGCKHNKPEGNMNMNMNCNECNGTGEVNETINLRDRDGIVRPYNITRTCECEAGQELESDRMDQEELERDVERSWR